MTDRTVAFIGGGNMTLAIASGLLDNGYPAKNISIAEPFPEQRKRLQKSLRGVFVSDDNGAVVARAGSVVLAVKPQILPDVCKGLAATVQNTRPFVISIAAGPRIADIDSWLGGGNTIARVMPNQPSLLGKGVSAIYANDASTPEQLATAREIMSAVGPVIDVDEESDIDAVTAISGSGPAYFYLLIDMLSKTGASLGLDPSVSSQLAVETALGAATLAKASGDSMDDLIARVRSPGGTTAAALDSLEDQGIRDIFQRALTAARDRATKLADAAHDSAQD